MRHASSDPISSVWAWPDLLEAQEKLQETSTMPETVVRVMALTALLAAARVDDIQPALPEHLSLQIPHFDVALTRVTSVWAAGDQTMPKKPPAESESTIPGGPPAERRRMFEDARRPQNTPAETSKHKPDNGASPKTSPDQSEPSGGKPDEESSSTRRLTRRPGASRIVAAKPFNGSLFFKAPGTRRSTTPSSPGCRPQRPSGRVAN